MIKANELRTGNWLIDICGAPSQFSFEWQKHYFDLGLCDVFDKINPIQITPEILEKCGFELIPQKISIYQKDKLRLWVGIGCICYLIDKNNKSHYMLDIKHLHHLQNLFFSVTGSELKINL